MDCLLTRVKSRCVFASIPICETCFAPLTTLLHELLLAWENFGAMYFYVLCVLYKYTHPATVVHVQQAPIQRKLKSATKLLSILLVGGPMHGMCIAWIKTRRGRLLWL